MARDNVRLAHPIANDEMVLVEVIGGRVVRRRRRWRIRFRCDPWDSVHVDLPEDADLEIDRVKDHLCGTNPRITSTSSMVKTTPPGTGSRLLRLGDSSPISAHFERRVQGVRLIATGPFHESDLGTACYHSKVGAVELLLNHLIDGPGEYVVMDMTRSEEHTSELQSRRELVCR